jgi:hypothetical protein
MAGPRVPARWWIVLIGLGIAAVVFAVPEDDDDDPPQRPSEPAYWHLAGEPSTDAEVLAVKVEAAGCDGPVHGTVTEEGDEVRVQLVVSPDDDPCVTGIERDVELRLDDELGDRVILAVDCPPDVEGSEPHERGCPVPEG